jgi:hypothetical protein
VDGRGDLDWDGDGDGDVGDGVRALFFSEDDHLFFFLAEPTRSQALTAVLLEPVICSTVSISLVA